MKPQWQQFQRQQQQQRQRMMQGAAWMEQQKLEQQKKSGKPPAVVQRKIDKRFAKVEQEAARLRKKYAAGKLSEEALIKKLSEMMIRDAQGYWWIVGVQSGDWYYYDGSDWVTGVPPSRGAVGIDPVADVKARPTGIGRIFKSIFNFIFSLVVSLIFFYVVQSISYDILLSNGYELADIGSIALGAVVGLIIFVIAIRD